MMNLFKLSLLALLQLLACSTVDAFHTAHVSKSLTRSVLPKAEPFNGHWSLLSTELRNENAFSKTSFTSEATTYTSKRDYLKAASIEVTSRAARKLKDASQSLTAVRLSDGIDQVLRFILQYWWSLPAFLALVPLYTTYVAGVGDAFMPHWWPCTPMEHIVKKPDAAMVLSVFLGSNIAFFLGGGYLMKKFPLVKAEQESTNRSIAGSQMLPAPLLGLVARLQSLKMTPTRQTWLGILLLLSGLISTIFHTEQALGSYSVANSLCYLDHAVAGTSTFYFFHTCGKPSRKVWCLGIAGLAALSFVPPHPLPGYAWLHSLWHFLASAAAVLWAVESFDSPQGSPMVQALPSISKED